MSGRYRRVFGFLRRDRLLSWRQVYLRSWPLPSRRFTFAPSAIWGHPSPHAPFEIGAKAAVTWLKFSSQKFLVAHLISFGPFLGAFPFFRIRIDQLSLPHAWYLSRDRDGPVRRYGAGHIRADRPRSRANEIPW